MVRGVGRPPGAVPDRPSSEGGGTGHRAAPTATPLLRATGLVKSYPGVRALKGVDLELVAGEVHALIGENGAGKSTLIKLITGAVPADAGTVEVHGRVVDLPTPAAALAVGIAAVHQEPHVVPALSAVENVFLGHPMARMGFTRRRAMEERFRARCTELGVEVPASVPAGALPVGAQQMIEIVRALEHGARIVIMDEPTASLGREDREALFRVMAHIRAQGTAVVFISHNLEDVLQLADRISVLRDGSRVFVGPTAHVGVDQLVQAMLGRELEQVLEDAPHETPRRGGGPSRLSVRGLDVPGRLHQVDLDVAPGEIVGLAGLVGSGRSTLVRALAGAEPSATGQLWIDGEARRWPTSPRRAQRLGIALAPEDRRTEGLVLGLAAADNLVLPSLGDLSRLGFASRSRLRAAAAGAGDAGRVRPGPRRRGDRHPLGREPAEGRAREAAAHPSRAAAGRRADEGRRHRRQSRDLPDARIARGRRHGRGDGLGGDRGARLPLRPARRAAVGPGGRDVPGPFGRPRADPGRHVPDRRVNRGARTMDGTPTRAAPVRIARMTLQRFGILVALFVLVIVVQTQSSRFLEPTNLFNMGEQWAPVAIMAIGMTFVLIGGGFDLSVGATFALSATLASSLAADGHPAWVAVAAALGAGVLAGLVNGILVTRININPLIATLGVGQVVRGLALVYSDGDTYSVKDPFFDTLGSGSVGPVPVPLIVTLVLGVVLAVVLARSVYGRSVYAVGGNAEASYLAGVPVDLVRIGTYVLSGSCAALAGMVYIGRVGSGQANIGSGIELQVIAAVLIGGISIAGGEGAMWRAGAGVCVLAVLQNFFNQANVNGFWQSIVQGLIIILAVGIDSYGKGRHRTPLRTLLRRPPKAGGPSGEPRDPHPDPEAFGVVTADHATPTPSRAGVS